MNFVHSFFVIAALTAMSFYGCSTPTTSSVAGDDEIGDNSPTDNSNNSARPKNIYDAVMESGKYTVRDSVAAYLCKFDKLPQNYVNKGEGQKLYESSTGNTFSKWNFNPWKTLGVMIGGDSFSNNEGLLPNGTYHEADVDYGNATSRGTKRLIYQSGCIVYYTADHYESFKKLEIQKN